MDEEIRKLIREYPEAADIPRPTKIEGSPIVLPSPEERKEFLQTLREVFGLDIPEDW